jgi:hypothetical protein
MKALGPDLANKVNAIALNSGRITVIAEASAWATRIKFQLAEIEPELRKVTPGFRDLVVRVRPRRVGR